MAFKHFWVQYKLGTLSDQAYIKANTFVIGRAPDCDLPIPTDILSRKHLQVFLEEDKIFVMDLGSTNGTFLQGQRLTANEKYEYKTGNRLYLDAGKECSLRITPIYQRDIVDLDLEQKGLELEKKKNELKNRKRINHETRDQKARDHFIANASESVDNIFENLIYVAKSARFNKEKKIREAENISHEMIEKAQQEIDEQRTLLAKELKVLQTETKKEANRLLKAANEKAANHMKKAEAKARQVRQQADEIKSTIEKEAETKKQQIIDQAQEKHSQIIAEAYLKNKELKEENQKIDNNLEAQRQEKTYLHREIEALKRQKRENEELTQQSKDDYNHELKNLNDLRSQVLDLEKKKSQALDALESQIPALEEKVSEMKKLLADGEAELKSKESEADRYIKTIESKKQELLRFEEKSQASEKRLDELNAKIIDAEDNLFRLNKIKQQRNEELDKEINERRELQKEQERLANEQLAKKRERVNKEIEVNLAKAKDKALSLITEATEEAEKTRVTLLEQANETLANAKAESEKQLKESQELRDEAQQYHDKVAREADAYAKLEKENIDLEISSRRKDFELEIQESKDKLLFDSRELAKKTKEQARAKADQIIAEAEAKAAQILLDVKGKADQDLESLQKEIEERKLETDKEIQGIRAHTVQKMEEQKRQWAIEEEERNRIRVLRLRKDLNEVVRARITPFLKDPSNMEKVSHMIGKSINAILLDEVEDEIFDAENYSDIDPTLQQAQVKKFYSMAIAAAVVAIGLMIFWSDIKDYAKDSGRSIATDLEKQDQAQIEKAKKQHDLSAAFNPEMKDEYLDSYTDRVLYTKDYLKLENDPGFKEQWRIELEEFFVDKLRLTETQMVPFVAREAALIKEMSEARKKINGNFVDQGRKRMLEIEADFYKRLKQGGFKQKQLDQINKFKKKFFEANHDLFAG